VPETLDEWTLEAVRRLTRTGCGENDRFDFKRVLDPVDGPDKSEFTIGLRRSACSFANSRGGFLVFGVSETGRGEDRIVGIPFSRDNGSRLQEKLRTIEPSIVPLIKEPQIDVGNGRALLVAEIPRGTRGPYWDPAERRFVKRGQGTTANMTHDEIRMAYIDHAERVSRLRLVFLSLIDNWLRLESIVKQGDGGPFVLPTVNLVSIQIYLGEVQALKPELVVPLLELLRELDAIAAHCEHMRALSHAHLKGREEFLRPHRREIQSQMTTLRDQFSWILARCQTEFGFESIKDRQGRTIPPLPI
jgi:hypothetical protein